MGIPGVEVIPVNPRKTEVTENVALIQKIYEENRVSYMHSDTGCHGYRSLDNYTITAFLYVLESRNDSNRN